MRHKVYEHIGKAKPKEYCWLLLSLGLGAMVCGDDT